MHALAALAIDAPDWVIAEMPPGYQTRIAEIRRLSEELEDMGRFARLLWATGADLVEPVRDVFTALRFDADLMEPGAYAPVAVRVDGQRRLLLHVAASDDTIDKKSVEVEQAFRLLHQEAGERDRVVLVANSDPMRPPPDRAEAVTPDALKLLQRMGVNCLTSPTLFRLWILSSHNPERARKFITQLHEQDGGTFTIPS